MWNHHAKRISRRFSLFLPLSFSRALLEFSQLSHRSSIIDAAVYLVAWHYMLLLILMCTPIGFQRHLWRKRTLETPGNIKIIVHMWMGKFKISFKFKANDRNWRKKRKTVKMYQQRFFSKIIFGERRKMFGKFCVAKMNVEMSPYATKTSHRIYTMQGLTRPEVNRSIVFLSFTDKIRKKHMAKAIFLSSATKTSVKQDLIWVFNSCQEWLFVFTDKMRKT